MKMNDSDLKTYSFIPLNSTKQTAVFNNAKHEEFMLNVRSMWENHISTGHCNRPDKSSNLE